MTTEIMAKEIIEELKKKGVEKHMDVFFTKKNGITKIGIRIGDENDSKCSPIYYFDENQKVEEIVKNIVNNLEEYEIQSKQIAGMINWINDWNEVKNKIFCCVQRKTDEEIFKKPLLDMELYLRISVDTTAISGSVKVTPLLTSKWGIDTEGIFDTAIKNTLKDLEINSLCEIVTSACGEVINLSEPLREAVVITNSRKHHGAAGLFILLHEYGKYYHDIQKLLKKKYVILPSSIHEGATRFAA